MKNSNKSKNDSIDKNSSAENVENMDETVPAKNLKKRTFDDKPHLSLGWNFKSELVQKVKSHLNSILFAMYNN